MSEFNIEKTGSSKSFLFSDESIPNNSDINVVEGRNNSKNHSRPHYKPNLNENNYSGKQHQRPSLSQSSAKKGFVPMDGLDLLTNRNKFDRDDFSTGKESYREDDDEDEDEQDLEDEILENRHRKNYSEQGSSSESRSEGSSDRHSRSRSRTNSRSVSQDSESGQRKKTYQEIQLDKQKLLFILNRLDKAGYSPTRKFTMASNYDDIEYEVTRLKRERDINKSVKFQRKLLMAFTSGVEFLNNKFDPIGAKLDDWSEHIMEGIGEYDEIFEELHDKYADKIEVAPELKLIMMVSGSAFMYHLTQTLFKSATPGLQDILRNNPDIMRNISEAALNNMKNSDPEMAGAFNFMSEGINMRGQSNRNRQGGNNGGGGGMEGPSGVEDILDELDAEAGGNNGRQRRRGRNDDNSINIDV